MKKPILVLSVLAITALCFTKVAAQHFSSDNPNKKKVLYFKPSIEPQIEEISEPTYSIFSSTISDKISLLKKFNILPNDAVMDYDEIDQQSISEYCKNNDADYAIVPKVKYFKVGIGKYVFSNQVIASMKLFDRDGVLISETHYDTYRKNKRLLGSTTNSVKIGVNGATDSIFKELKKIKKEQ